MTKHNSVTLIGNMGSEAKVIEGKDRTFVALSLATTDSFQDEEGQWQNKETVWHNVLAFSPIIIEGIQALKKGTRIKVEGSLSYRAFEVTTNDGQLITKYEASVIASRIEQAILVKKTG